MRNGVTFVFAVALSVVAAGAEGLTDAGADKNRIQGEWRVAHAEAEGEKAPAEFLKRCRVVVTNESITFFVGEEKHEHSFKLDPTATPKSIDLVALDGPRKGKTMSGIYAVEKGGIRLCLPVRSGEGTARPKEFKSTEGDRLSVFDLEPAKAP